MTAVAHAQQRLKTGLLIIGFLLASVHGAVAYALNASSARYLLSHLPMKVPVDHFLWHMTRGKGAYVSTKYVVKHGKSPSVRKTLE